MLTPDYLAGLFDGEGCVSLIYTKIRPWKRDPDKHVVGFKFVVLIANTHRGIIDALLAQFGGDAHRGTPRVSTHKPVWSWRLGSTATQRAFLEAIQPAAIIKAPQIRLGLEYLDTKVASGKRVSPELWSRRLAIFTQLREINRRGATKAPAHSVPDMPSGAWNPKKRGYSDDELAAMMLHVRSNRRGV